MIRAAIVGLGWWGKTLVEAVQQDSKDIHFVAGTTTSYDFPVTDATRNLSTHFAESPDSAATWRPLGSSVRHCSTASGER